MRHHPVIIALCVLVARPAFADPCTGKLPRQAGERFAGTVRHIIDGDGLCVGRTSDPRDWIEVRLADFNAPELHDPGGPDARAALDRLTMGRAIACVAVRGRNGRVRSYDRVIAACTLDGQSLGDRMRAAGIAEGGN